MRAAHLTPVIALLRGLTDPVVNLSMGQTAENLAWRLGIGREAMDAFALRSHRRLAAAQNDGRFDGEVEPLYGPDGAVYERDDGVRPDTDMERLARLKPAFDRPFGLVTAGNSAQISDGAAWLLLAGEEAVERYGLSPRARLVDTHWAGLDPAAMGLGPAHAVPPLLEHNQLTLSDVDYWEINEAFAAQVLACLEAWKDEDYCRRELDRDSAVGELDPENLNVDGGAVSLGHPLGASGTRIILHLLHVLERNEARRGVASLCVGGGQGGAVLIEREQ
jgi:acetyl-CoA C-acetyltransferase